MVAVCEAAGTTGLTLAIAVIPSATTTRNLEDPKSTFSKLFGDYLYNTSLKISKTSVSDLQVFLKSMEPNI